MGYQLGDGTKLALDVAWTDADGIQRPANWLRLSTERDRELLGITWVAETNQVWDQRFYWGYDSRTTSSMMSLLLMTEGNEMQNVRPA